MKEVFPADKCEAKPKKLGFDWKAAAVTLPFLLLYWIDIAHHTMFFDEVNAWAMSAASPNLKTLFHYVHFEGHPWSWYFLLWFPSRLTHDPVAMKWLVAPIATASIVVLGMLSPFNLAQRALLLSGFFFAWEYTVMCRMYSVMLLLALLYTVRRSRRPAGVIGCCILLGAMANSDMMGMLLSGALLIEYVYSSYQDKSLRLNRSRWLTGIVVYVALVALSIVTLWPARDISWTSSGPLGSGFFDWHEWLHAFGNMIAGPWWTINPYFPDHFWLTTVEVNPWLYALVPFVLFGYWMTFRKDKNLLLLMGSTLVIGILFADLVYAGSPRHWGIAVVAMVVGLWLRSAQQKEKNGVARPWSIWTYGLLAISTLAGSFAIAGSWMHPFSRAREAAKWLRDNEGPSVMPLGMPDTSFASLAEELQRPVYFVECDCIDTFKLFSKNRENYDESELPRLLQRASVTLRTKKMLFVFYRPFDDDDLGLLKRASIQTQLVTSFSDADTVLEDYYFYEVDVP
jgi:hypothetical protein